MSSSNTTNEKIITLHLSCHCGTFNHAITVPSSKFPLKSSVCHCTTCRRISGQLFASFAVLPLSVLSETAGMEGNDDDDGSLPASLPSFFPTHGLKAYNKTPELTRWFCETCGASCFNDDRNGIRSDEDGEGEGRIREIEIATGVVTRVDMDNGGTKQMRENGVEGLFERVQLWIGDTLDGGAAVWVNSGKLDDEVLGRMDRRSEGRKSRVVSDEMLEQMVNQLREKTIQILHKEQKVERTMKVNCSCGDFNLQIPMADGERFKAGVDACTSCRVVSGFELTVWAAIPISSVTRVFQFVPSDTVGTYKTSEKVTRFFCRSCGATIFYLNDDRDTVDIGVGLIETEDGARAESVLTWDKYGSQGLMYAEDAIDKIFVKGISEGREATMN